MLNRRKIRNYYSLRRPHITNFYYFTLFSFIITIDQHWLYKMDINRFTKFSMNFHTFIELAVKVFFFMVVYIFQYTHFLQFDNHDPIIQSAHMLKVPNEEKLQKLTWKLYNPKNTLIGFWLGRVRNIILIICPMRRTSFGRDKIHYSNDLTLCPRVDLSFLDQHVVSI
jgi:hypothetical protein